ncbi:N-acetylglucosamine-6-phosphate deacetylase [Microbacterium testaceum StLB037]|uniref:N-acetylglucosamine-6-phosphate deacetylase n=1 Tax=Microbacterium testaceum (strain StLB037) TaxID=979556 RepID=E8N8E7_MICTS|nr:amidohydrolase family protein [Microbacterium testaceum]BAJ74392.1 N-acetylglucosamine-6-phosphate deacetylase [Microbacterium testaceum StLB037]
MPSRNHPPVSTLSGPPAAPAFVDLHCHGALGHGFDDADIDGVRAAVEHHRAHGTETLLLSLVSAPVDRMARRLGELAGVLPRVPGVAGVHLEGPFLAHGRRGAHDPEALTVPSAEAAERLIEAGNGIVRAVTIAPELPGATEAIDRFVAAGVAVAVGHTEADYDTAAAAFDRGASLLTHAFNAMPGLGHRAPGPVGAALARDHVVLEVIADGVHVHPVVMRTLFDAAPHRVALVTDAMSATGLGDGVYRLGGLDVEVRDARPVLVGTDTLAGSTLTMDRAVATAIAAGVPEPLAWAAASTVPARVLA